MTFAALAEQQTGGLQGAYGGYDGKGQAMLEQTTIDAGPAIHRFADGADTVSRRETDFE